jgi:hypothetical protein
MATTVVSITALGLAASRRAGPHRGPARRRRAPPASSRASDAAATGAIDDHSTAAQQKVPRGLAARPRALSADGVPRVGGC